MSAPALPLLIWGVRGQWGVEPPSKWMLMWFPSILLLPVVGNMLRLPFIWMVLRVILSLEVALLDSLSGGPAHNILISTAGLVCIACRG